jgi:hypothetical protein
MGGGICINGGWIPKSAVGGLMARAHTPSGFVPYRSLPDYRLLTDRRRDFVRTGWS